MKEAASAVKEALVATVAPVAPVAPAALSVKCQMAPPVAETLIAKSENARVKR